MQNTELAKEALKKLELIQKALKLKLTADPAPGDPQPAEPVELAAEQLTGKDGTIYTTSAPAEAGVEIMVVATDGDAPAPDGDIELEDGRVLTVKDGKIESIKESPLGADPNVPMEAIMSEIAAFKTQMSAIESDNNALRAEIAAIKTARAADNAVIMEAFETNLSAIDAVAKAPIGGEGQKANNLYVKRNNEGGPLGRKQNEA